MKKLFFILIFGGLILTSCGSDDEPSSKYNFEDQVAQGQIEGEAWSFKVGKAFLSEDLDGNVIYSMRMYGMQETFTEPCGEFADFNEVFFYLPTEIGLYELKFGGRTATLLFRETYYNILASDGAIEILTISDTEITGRLDIRSGENNFINGNFRLDICGN